MASNPLPTLSTLGYLTSPMEKADRLMSYFFESDASQSQLFTKSVYSLQYLIQQHNQDIPTLCGQIKTNLTNYLNGYFDSSEVECTYSEEDNKVTIKLYADVVENGKKYSLGKLIETINGSFNKVISLNN